MNILISNLAEHPYWISNVAAWHHEEWQKGFAENESKTDVKADVKGREKRLVEHCTEEAVPSTFIAHTDDDPVGSVSLVYYYFKHQKTRSVWLTNLYVTNEYRCRGIGQDLLNYAISFAKQVGLTHIKLYTRDQSEFYTKRRWSFVQGAIVQGAHVDILERKIS